MVLGTLVMAGIGLTACRREQPRELPFQVMGTMGSVIAGVGEVERCERYAETTLELMKEMEATLSLYRPASELSQFNAQAGKGLVATGGHLTKLLGMARLYGALSHGAFDVTVGPVVRAWGFSGGRKPEKVPDQELLKEKMALVGYTNIVTAGVMSGLARSGMVVDLGGLAKGYAVDVCCRALLKQGAKDFVVNLAGNMRCYGKPEAGRSWRVGVRDPFHAGAVIGMIELGEGMAVATSGNYERFVEIEGKRYSHIVDPRTGWPVTGMAGVTVVAPSAAAADALSTAFFVLGPEEGNKVLGLFTNCAALFVPDKDGLEIQLTPGMDRYFKMSPDVKARVTTLGGGAVAGSMDKPRADQ
jgi:thiamine biosynthesis lipoprotein ApbE